MPINNPYNPNPVTVDSLLNDQQNQFDASKTLATVAALPKPAAPAPKNYAVPGAPDPNAPKKTFLQKVGSDISNLAYGIPVGVAKIVTGLATHPINTIEDMGIGIAQGAVNTINPSYYTEHPVEAAVNLATFVQPVAGIAKSSIIKAASSSVVDDAINLSIKEGVEEGAARLAINPKTIGTAVNESFKLGKPGIVNDTVRNALTKNGVASDVAFRVATQVADNLGANITKNAARMGTYNAILHPLGALQGKIAPVVDPLRQMIFGEPAKTAVGTMFGPATVSKNPEGFLNIERWAEAQTAEHGMENTALNRQRVMQGWVDQNTQWASLTPEEQVAHFENYAKQDLIRLQIHNATGLDIVTTKALPQNYVDAMVNTLKASPETDVVKMVDVLKDNFGNDYGIHSTEIEQAISRNPTKEGLIEAISKLGDTRASISFAEFSPAIQKLADDLEKTGYRIGYAPKNKPLSFASDIMAGSDNTLPPTVPTEPNMVNLQATKKILSEERKSYLSDFKNTEEGTGVYAKAQVDIENKVDFDGSVVSGVKSNSFFKKEGTINDQMGNGWLLEKNGRYAVVEPARVEEYVGKGWAKKIEIDSLAKEAGFDNGNDYLEYQMALSEKNALLTTPEKALHENFYSTDPYYKSIVDEIDNLKAQIKQYDQTRATSGAEAVGGTVPKTEGVPQGTPAEAGQGINPAKTTLGSSDLLTKRTWLGRFIENMGFSPQGTVEAASEYSFRHNFTQRLLADGGVADKFAGVVTADGGKVHIPVENLYKWLNDHRMSVFQRNRGSIDRWIPIRTVFDITEKDLVRAGFDATAAKMISTTSKDALRSIPMSVVGMGDKVVNYLRTSNKGFGKWMSEVYDKGLQLAYKGRYDWSPFFGAQQYVETRINSALLLKDPRAFIGGGPLTKLGDWTAEKLGIKVLQAKDYLRNVVAEPPIEEVALVQDEILHNLQNTTVDAAQPDVMNIQNSAMGGLEGLKDKAAFNDSIRSRNVWNQIIGQSQVKMAVSFNKALAQKYGFTLEDALKSTVVDGKKVYTNPSIVQTMRESTQAVYHYQVGFLTSPLMKTLNTIWFPLRFEVKTAQLASRWLGSLSPISRMTVMNNWVNFSNWTGTPEGIKWRRANRNIFYQIFNYTAAYAQMAQGIEAVTKGRFFGGNAGLIGGVPFGFMVNIARGLNIMPEDKDQYNPVTGKLFQKEVTKKVVSLASLSTALEQTAIAMSPGTPFYSLTGGSVVGLSLRSDIQNLVRQVVGDVSGVATGVGAAKGKTNLNKQFKMVPLGSSIFNKTGK